LALTPALPALFALFTLFALFSLFTLRAFALFSLFTLRAFAIDLISPLHILPPSFELASALRALLALALKPASIVLPVVRCHVALMPQSA
jgi:hypothetical protein